MKRAFLPLLLLALLTGCASTQDGAAQSNNGVYDDPTYPGAGVHIGIGAGRWGGHSGGGIGVGLGW